MEKILAAVEAFVAPDYEQKDTMHGAGHIRRVIRLATKLGRHHPHDPEVLTLAAWFHGNIYFREAEIRPFLSAQGLDSPTIEAVVKAAQESQTGASPASVEGSLLHDAHLLEGGRTFLITKSLVSGSARGQTLEETLAFIEDNVLKQECFCRFPEAQILYEEKLRFAREYVADLRASL